MMDPDNLQDPLNTAKMMQQISTTQQDIPQAQEL